MHWIALALVGCQEYDLLPDDVVVDDGRGPVLEVTPAVLDFGSVGLGDTSTLSFTASNVGVGPLTVLDVALDAPGPFTLVALGDDAVLEGGESADWAVTFAPDVAGGVARRVRVTSDAPVDPNGQVLLRGDAPETALHDVSLLLTVDDAWDGFLDGVAFSAPNQRDWRYADLIEWQLEAGDHTLAVHGFDQQSVVSGLIAVLSVDGVPVEISGTAAWRMTSTTPPADWADPLFDDASWGDARACANQTTWGTYWPAELLDDGAEWVWWTDNCSNLREAWFRLTFTL